MCGENAQGSGEGVEAVGEVGGGGEAEGAEGGGGEGAALADGADGDDGVMGAGDFGDSGFDEGGGDGEGGLGEGEESGFPWFADIEDDGVRVGDEGGEFCGVQGGGRGGGECAGEFGVEGGSDGGIGAADRAGGVAPEGEGAGGHGERVEVEETPDERLAETGEELDGFGGLECSDETGDCAEDAGFGAGGDGAWGRRGGEHAAVAGATGGGVEDGELAFEAMDGAVDVRDAAPCGDIAAEVARGEVVSAVEDEIAAVGEVHGVGGAEAVVDDGDAKGGVEGLEAGGGGGGFGLAGIGFGEEDLALEIGEGDDIVVDDDEVADAGGGEVEEGWAAETASAETEDGGAGEFILGFGAEAGEGELTGKTAEPGVTGLRRGGRGCGVRRHGIAGLARVGHFTSLASSSAAEAPGSLTLLLREAFSTRALRAGD